MKGSFAAAMQAAIGSASPSENSIGGSPPCLKHSIVTIESLPPPTGTHVLLGRSTVIGVGAGAELD
jgi:hypothetical protein